LHRAIALAVPLVLHADAARALINRV